MSKHRHMVKYCVTQGVTNNSVLNNQIKQQYSYSVFGLSQYRIVFGIRYYFFWLPKQYSGIQMPVRISVQIVSKNLKTKYLVLGIYVDLCCIFSKFCILFGIQYQVLEQLDQIVLFVFSIKIFSILNSILYSVF